MSMNEIVSNQLLVSPQVRDAGSEELVRSVPSYLAVTLARLSIHQRTQPLNAQQIAGVSPLRSVSKEYQIDSGLQ